MDWLLLDYSAGLLYQRRFLCGFTSIKKTASCLPRRGQHSSRSRPRPPVLDDCHVPGWSVDDWSHAVVPGVVTIGRIAAER